MSARVQDHLLLRWMRKARVRTWGFASKTIPIKRGTAATSHLFFHHSSHSAPAMVPTHMLRVKASRIPAPMIASAGGTITSRESRGQGDTAALRPPSAAPS